MAAVAATTAKPQWIARISATIEPITDAALLAPHAHGTSSGAARSTRRIPRGQNTPIGNASTKTRPSDSAIFAGTGHARAAEWNSGGRIRSYATRITASTAAAIGIVRRRRNNRSLHIDPAPLLSRKPSSTTEIAWTG